MPNTGSRMRAFTLVELLVVIAIMLILASLSYAGIILGRDIAKRGACISNLKQIGLAATCFAMESETRSYPWAGENATATDHMNLLVQKSERLVPELFLCPASSGKVRAKEDENGRFTLTKENCSYGWSRLPLSDEDGARRILVADAAIRNGDSPVKDNHRGGLCVYRIGGSAEYVRASRVPEELVSP